MATLECKMCGGNLILRPDSTIAECDSCGREQTVPSADNEKKLTLFARANRLRYACEFDKAAGVYEAIVADFPREAEAYWGLVLCHYGVEYVDDYIPGRKVPTCHRSSFNSILEDDNYEQALENASADARKLYRQEARELEEIRKRILEVSSKEEPYDIFICYKETDAAGNRTLDSVIAQDIYDALTAKGYRVFFARISLEDNLGKEYEPYIFAALNSAKLMLVVGTDYEHFNAVWVKNEWSRFLKLMAEDRSRHLIPCYKGIDAYDMPREFAKLQAQDMGKVGADRDLLRGIEKLLPKKTEKETTVKETVVVQQAGGTNANAFVKRGNMALEDRLWDKADGFFEEALNHDAECAEAYVGKFLVQKKMGTLQDWSSAFLSQTQNCQSRTAEVSRDEGKEEKLIRQYCLPGFGYADKAELEKILKDYKRSYTVTTDARRTHLQQAKQIFEQDRLLSRAYRFAKGSYADEIGAVKKEMITRLESRLDQAKKDELSTQKQLAEGYVRHLQHAEELFKPLRQKAEQTREAQYVRLCDEQAAATTAGKFEKLSAQFNRLGDYKDARARARQCTDRCLELQKQARDEQRRKEKAEEEERRRIAEEAARRERKAKAIKTVVTLVVIAAIVAGAAFGISTLLSNLEAQRASDYAAAESLYAAGDYDAAIQAFKDLGKYKDSADRVLQITYEKAESLFAAGDYDGAIAVFTELANYSDSAARILEVKYKKAATMMDSGDHRSAITVLRELGDYSDAKAKLLTAWESVAQRQTVAMGVKHVVALKSDGTVYATGMDDFDDYDYGQCDVSGWTDIVAIACGYYHTVGLKSDGTVVAVGQNYSGQCDVSGWTDVVAIVADKNRTACLRSDGSVLMVGDEMFAGDLTEWTDIVAISLGGNHLLGIKSDGTAVCVKETKVDPDRATDWQRLEALSISSVPIIGNGNVLGLCSDGTVNIAGDDGNNLVVTGWTDIVSVCATFRVSFGVKSDGTVVYEDHYGLFKHDLSGWTDVTCLVSDGDCVIGLRKDGTLLVMGDFGAAAEVMLQWTDIKVPN